eukprot:TRINITY_DN36075_c0_g1_i1.p1 TRINITY_DN36075_c0_g1~~TRINITY_DN36075_c0_g1_i1.p1  ORF type:complete len:493 (-),score=60.68 TRINITY_DN36075_c0_g1_i1:48-1526(-)
MPCEANLVNLPSSVIVNILSCVTYDCKRLSYFSTLCTEMHASLSEDGAWWHLCKKYWFATDERLRDWPSLSPKGLYRALEQWTPVEGYYTLASAFPWGLLVLVRIHQGRLIANVIRFVPEPAGSFIEVQVPLFQVSITEEKPGVVSSTVSAKWLADEPAIFGAHDPHQLEAHTLEARQFGCVHIARGGLFLPRRALRIAICQREEPEVVQSPGAGGYGEGTDAEIDDSSADEPLQNDLRALFESWHPGELLRSEEEAQSKTETMLDSCLHKCRVPCDLALIRSPQECVPHDPSVPRLRPGLYVGDYGHSFYGQFRTEVLLLEYISLTPEQLSQEVMVPSQVFTRPGGEAPPEELSKLADMHRTVSFVRGVKQCGDFHVPMGATTFVAVCGPPEACAALTDMEAPRSVLCRQTHRQEVVVRAWRGFGTLARPILQDPSWAGGWLVQFENDDERGDHRFGFVWDRNQEAVVLRWVVLQDSSPFLQRAWLPEGVR